MTNRFAIRARWLLPVFVLLALAGAPRLRGCDSCRSAAATDQSTNNRSAASGTSSSSSPSSAGSASDSDGSFEITDSESLGQFFSRLFRADFMPHGHCFWWKPEIIWLHVISDALIGLAYFSIPAMLFYFIRRRKDLPFHWMFHLFAAFILWCGLTHFLHVYTLWFPVYRAEGLAKAITAAISVLTAIFLYPLIPKALALRSPDELAQKNRELEEANQKIRESERLKSEFLSNLSHELRTPLTLILSPLDSLIAAGAPLVPQAGQITLFKTMHSNAVRLYQLINGLLDLAKVEAEKMEPQSEEIDLPALTRSVFKDFRPLLETRNLDVSLKATEERHLVSIDHYLYERVLFNLLSNAIKFTPDGGKIEVALSFEGDWATLSVSDTGIGISEEDRKVLFQRFRQIQRASTKRHEGTGLGLSLVKEFVALLGGEVHLHSEPGRGSVFSARLRAPVVEESSAEGSASLSSAASAKRKYFVPVAPPAPVESLRSDLASSSGSSGKWNATRTSGVALPKLLIAEDNSELARYITSLVENSFEVRTVANGADALSVVASWRPEVILSDVSMPVIDGLELCRKVKADPQLGGTPVVLLTALSDRTSLLKGWENGADEYLFKPFHPTELITRLKSIASLAQQRRAANEARKRLEELEHFSYIASHDLKEPLRTMRTFGQLLERRCGDSLDAESQEYLRHLIGSSGRMHELVSDLSTYAELGSRQDKIGPVEMERLWDDVVESLGVQVKEAKAEVSRGPLPTVTGVSSQLSLLLQNLVTNALKFRGTEVPKIRIDAETHASEWIFHVRDNGIGFEEKYAERVFLVFKRLHDKEAYPGTGMGLAICKKVATQHGGRIWAQSSPGKGSTFYFSIPRIA